MTDSQQNLNPEAIDEATQQLLDEFESRKNLHQESEPVSEPVPEEPTQEQEEFKYAWLKSEEDLAKIDELYKWANSLTRDQVELIDRVLTGDLPTAPPSTPQVEDDEDEDDEITQLRRRLAALEQDTIQTRTQQTIKSTQETIESESIRWAEENGLSEDDLEVIQTELVRSGMFKSLNETYGLSAGLRKGLDFFYKQSNLYAEQQAEAIRQKALADQQRLEERARKASAFSGGSGSVTAPEEPPTRQGHKKRANLTAVARFLDEQN